MKFIPVAEPYLGKNELKLVTDCVKSTWVSSAGSYITQFEKDFAHSFKTPFAISCSNGTSALHLALLALDISPGDEVIVPALTFVATANAIMYVGAKAVLVDVDPKTWNISPTEIIKKLTPKTRAIIPVHLYGYPADMKAITQIAKKHHLYIVEDAAEAHAALYKDKHVGTIGDIGCFSFYGNKIITTGEGGMLLVRNKRVAQKIRLLKNHGMSPHKRYFHPIVGYNYRMTNLQAAIGVAQLKQLDRILQLRRRIATMYQTLLRDIPGLVFQPEIKDIQPVCWLFSFLVTSSYGRTRDQLMTYLKRNQVDSRPFFFPLHHFPMYKTKEKFPVAERLAKQGINLPSSPNLKVSQLRYIAHLIRSYAKPV